MLTAEQHEEVLGRVCEIGESVSFDVKATAAPRFRRIVRQRCSSAQPTVWDYGLGAPPHPHGLRDPLQWCEVRVTSPRWFCDGDGGNRTHVRDRARVASTSVAGALISSSARLAGGVAGDQPA